MNSALLFILAAGGAAAPATPVVQTPPPSDPLTALYLLVGTVVVGQLIGGIVTFVKWFSSRTVHQADEEKKQDKERVVELEKFKGEQERATRDAVRDVKELSEAVSKLTGTVAEISKQVDTRIEKQGGHYLAQLEMYKKTTDDSIRAMKNEYRAEITRAVAEAEQVAEAKRATQLLQQLTQQQQQTAQYAPRRRAPKKKPATS